MTTETDSAIELSDPAAVFACALSLWQASKKRAVDEKLNLSECFNGMDQFMREIMRIANQFESWSCLHIEFNELDEVWSYLLEDKFGETCLATVSLTALASFNDSDCLRVAMRLDLPIIFDDRLPIPVDITARNPVAGSAFKWFRIQTVRDGIENEDSSPYATGDDPFDEQYESPYFGLYGVREDSMLEFITSQPTYGKAVQLARKLAPGINLPDTP